MPDPPRPICVVMVVTSSCQGLDADHVESSPPRGLTYGQLGEACHVVGQMTKCGSGADACKPSRQRSRRRCEKDNKGAGSSHPERRVDGMEFLRPCLWAAIPPLDQQRPSWWRTEFGSAGLPSPRPGRSLFNPSRLAVIRVCGCHRTPPSLALIRAGVQLSAPARRPRLLGPGLG